MGKLLSGHCYLAALLEEKERTHAENPPQWSHRGDPHRFRVDRGSVRVG